MILIKNAEEIALMRESCALAAKTLHYASKLLAPGVSTEEINQKVHQFIIQHGARPSPLNYHGFPKSICTSKNEVICHGIPNEKEILKDGDIINIDITTYLNGVHGDNSATFLIGNVKPEVKKLVSVTLESLNLAIQEVKPGARLGNIGAVIEELAHKNNFTVVHEYCGHGIGRKFHEDPQILHFGKRNTGPTMQAGMIFTIEPMINMGQRYCKLLADGWTVITADGLPSAQFEHTILVTANGCEILTNWPADLFSI